MSCKPPSTPAQGAPIAGGPPLPRAPLVSAPTAPDSGDNFAPLLAVVQPDSNTAGQPDTGSAALRARLLERLQSSRRQSVDMHTTRPARRATEQLSHGVQATWLYQAAASGPHRAGEPLRTRLMVLAPGACWSGADADCHREWLLLRGSATLGGEDLSERDYHVDPAGAPRLALSSSEGCWLFLRESVHESSPSGTTAGRAFTLRDADADWPAFAPGIRRRVLWQHGGQAALLYHADAGASVPQHRHGHDEECLLVEGELFLDDLLLQPGDYQLATAGSGHRITQTDTGAVLYAHGDLDLQFTG